MCEYGQDKTYVFLGDYVDRGPDSKGVIDYLLQFKAKYHCIFLRGNHDAMLLNYVEDQSWFAWFGKGGANTMESYRKALGEERASNST